MNLSVLLNVAIGLILVYIVLSLIASEVQELITILLEWRAKHLKEAITHLLTSESSDVAVDSAGIVLRRLALLRIIRAQREDV